MMLAALLSGLALGALSTGSSADSAATATETGDTTWLGRLLGSGVLAVSLLVVVAALLLWAAHRTGIVEAVRLEAGRQVDAGADGLQAVGKLAALGAL